MIRKVIQIDEEKCTGCGLCAKACHEGAIGIVNGKAHLMRDDFCDGFGDCLPACPADAISFTEREAAAYDEAAVKRAKAVKEAARRMGGCPGSAPRQMKPVSVTPEGKIPSQLSQWPCQIKLVSPAAPWLNGCDLLIAADCTAYSYGDFHRDFIKGRITLIGCPKLDAVDYTDKLADIMRINDIRSVTMTRMTVPCCGGLERAVREAVRLSGKDIPVNVVTISIDGSIV